MRLGEYLKNYEEGPNEQRRLDGLINFFDFISKSEENTGRLATLGVDTLVNSWVRQQFAYREQLLEDLNIIAHTISEVASPLLHLRNEVFRKGLTWEPKFGKKCKDCGEEHENIVEECDKCHSKNLRDPDKGQLDVFKTFVSDCNCFDEDMESVLKQMHLSVNSLDDAFLYIGKEYMQKKPSDPIRSKIIEIRMLRTSAVEFDLDPSGLPKNNNWICRFHREIPPVKKEPDVEEFPKCSKCGRELAPVMYKYKHRGHILYLLDSEVCHIQKFWPDITYGFPPLLTIIEKALVILGMDRTIYKYFYEKKMPTSLLMVATDDTDSLRRARAEIIAQLKINPDYVPMVGYSAKTQRGRVDMVRLFHTLQEMDYLPVRQEIRERIAALWGLPPMWQAEMTGASGLSSQSQQMALFSRVVESDQRMFNEKVFPFLADAFGITDFELKLQQPEEKAEIARIQMSQQRISAASMLKQLGFKVEVKEGVESVDDIEFKVSGEMEEPQQGGGAFGGMPFNMALSQNPGWTNQVINKGYSIDTLDDVKILQNGSSALIFTDNIKNGKFVALFQPMGNLIDIYNAGNLHQHNGYPPHDVNMPHNTVSRHQPKEEEVFKDDDE